MIGGAMYAQYRTMKARDCLVLPAGATPADGASCFVNPLTSLGMVETMTKGGTILYEAAYTGKDGKKHAVLVKADGTETKD